MLCPSCHRQIDSDSVFCPFCGKRPSDTPAQAKSSYVIGRAPSCDIILDNIRVSRNHARLFQSGGNWVLEDSGSQNGTFVNGRRISSTPVSATDTIVIAGIPLRLEEIVKAKPQQLWTQKLRFVAQNLSYSVPEKTLIDDISLCFEPGQFIGLVGPSGCGKTTLMLMLNGYYQPTRGVVRLNNLSVHKNPEALKGQIGYVPQDDIIHRELTVEESLRYTSQLRLGNSLSKEERAAQIERIIKDLNLQPSRHVLIGSAERRGISGGQRKRVNMAQELVTEPLLYFLDEPTSGLDPRTDREVMTLLKGIADRGHIVVLTTHKIDRLNFSIFTHVIVIGEGGRLAYYGKADEAAAYFKVQDPEQIFEVLERRGSRDLQQDYLRSPHFRDMVANGMDKIPSEHVVQRSRFAVDPWQQYLVLVSRAFRIKARDTMSTLILLLQAPIIGLFLLLVFGQNQTRQYLPAMLFMALIAAIWLGCSNSAREIVCEQTIFQREHKAALSLGAYLGSKVTVLGLLCAVQCLILALFAQISFAGSGVLGIGFFPLFLVLLLTSFTAMLMGLAISALAKTGEAAMAIVPITLIPQIVLGGLIVYFKDLGAFGQLLAAPVLSRWAYELTLLLDGTQVADSVLGFNLGNIGADFAVILLLALAFTGTAFALLKHKTGLK